MNDELKAEIKKIRKRIESLSKEIEEMKSLLAKIASENVYKGVVRPREVEDSYSLALKYLKKVNREVDAFELSQALSVSRSRASEILNDLYRMGYIEKKRVGRTVKYYIK